MSSLLGVAASLPDAIRRNDDPIFAALIRDAPPGSELFRGYRERRVLAPDEPIAPHVARAGRRALEHAGRRPDEVDVLLGRVSLGERLLPEGLAEVHAALGLREDCWVLPLVDDFTNALTGLMVAHSLVESGAARTVLVAVGGDWSRNVDYATPQALSAADGAGAMVVGRPQGSGWTWSGAKTRVASQLCGAMTLPFPSGDRPEFVIGPAGREAFVAFGAEAVPATALELLDERGVAPSDVTLVSHQASAVLLRRWRDRIKPAAHLHTLPDVGNVTVANIPVTLARRLEEVRTEWLLLLGVGPMQHAVAVLLRRSVSR